MADRWTTPTLPIAVEGVDLTGCDVILTLRQGRRAIDIKAERFDSFEIDPNAKTAEIEVTLSQQQSSTFHEGEDVEVQLNYIDPNGFRGDTTIATTTFGRNLHESVMRHG